jgi:hypothetical protein
MRHNVLQASVIHNRDGIRHAAYNIAAQTGGEDLFERGFVSAFKQGYVDV